MRTLVWFRETDLRITDNKALYNAAKIAKEGVIAVFFLMPKLWRQQGYGKNKINFILRNVQELSEQLAKHNIALLIEKANSSSQVKQHLIKIADKFKLEALFFNKCYNVNFDEVTIEKSFANVNKAVFTYEDEMILPPGSVLNGQRKFYTIFTPFKKKWLTVFKEQEFKVLNDPKKQSRLLCKPDKLQLDKQYAVTAQLEKLWPAGEPEANKRLRHFIAKEIKQYHLQRDYPVMDATSHLSPYLACGVISPRICFQAALHANGGKIVGGDKGILTWMAELIWRDFYKHLLFAFPRLRNHEPFKLYTKKLSWKHDKKLFRKWKQGQTGFPLVDAAMQQLAQIGWMHNRLRMVVAAFLTKLLWIDWRWGEAYFAELLIDYDFSANNGGWQWSASTGADSVPYFRIFNPALQQKRYDPQGSFIKKYCSYSAMPIIDYQKARIYALKQFKAKIF